MPVPTWIKDAVFYQIFPDRFANGDPSNDPPNIKPWDSSPTVHGFQGGDLQGIVQHFDYLLDLGINAIYLNPIFLASSTHRYNTSDYFQIDPKLGDLRDFHALIDIAHRNHVRVILDGVFNHCGRGFFAFTDILENGAESPYLDWFHVKRVPLNAYTRGKARNYLAWWGIKSLPKFNTDTPAVRRYLLSVARYWIEQGADGWRLDVPNEIDDDTFWAEFSQVVKNANPEAYILGEIWDVMPRWLSENHFDGLMNYPVRTALLDLLTGKQSAVQFANRVEELLTVYPMDYCYAQFNLLGSHDTERIMTMMDGNLDKVKLAFLFQFAYPGTPSIYYGDEIGMPGGKDPDCRRTFPWQTSQWHSDLREWVKALIEVRKSRPSLRSGDLKRLVASETPNVYAFARVSDQERTIIAMNAGSKTAQVQIPLDGFNLADGQALRSLLDGRAFAVQGSLLTLTLAPFSGMYLA